MPSYTYHVGLGELVDTVTVYSDTEGNARKKIWEQYPDSDWLYFLREIEFPHPPKKELRH